MFDARGAHFGFHAHARQDLTHRRDLRGGQPADLAQRADPRDHVGHRADIAAKAVGERVDLVGQRDHAGLGQLEGGAPLGHGRPGLFGGAVEGDAHLGGILGKAQQFLARHGGPPGGGHDLGDPLGRHRDARAHLQNVVGHLGKGLAWEN
jgi:hypothetical protein